MTKRRNGLLVGSVLLALLAGGAVAEEEIVVDQKEKMFTPKRLQVRVRDKVVFTNSDLVIHNMYSRSEGNQFNLDMQQPGEKKEVVFDKPGKVLVRCAIHPKMRLLVTVND